MSINDTQRHIQLNIGKAHYQLKTGLITSATGLLLVSTSAYIYQRQLTDGTVQYPDIQKNHTQPVMMYIGIAVSAIGAVITIDSYKYFKRAAYYRSKKK